MIISSEVVQAIPQPNDTISIVEKHVYDTGEEYFHSYIASSLVDPASAATNRAAAINRRLQAEIDQQLAESNYEAPITVRKFLELLGLQNRLAIKAACANSPVLQDAYDYLIAGNLVFKGPATQWLTGLVQANLLTQEQVDTVLNGWPV
jgi:hypothetical protein